MADVLMQQNQESVSCFKSKKFQRIHSNNKPGRLHRGHNVAAATTSIPTKYQTVVVSNSDKKGFLSQAKRFPGGMQNDNPSPATYVGHKDAITDGPSMSRRGVGYMVSRDTRIGKQIHPVSAAPNAYGELPILARKEFNQHPTTAVFHKPIAKKADRDTGPGPADYTVRAMCFAYKNDFMTPNAAFTSKVKREIIDTKEARSKPAPCTYDIGETQTKTSIPVPRGVFLSRTGRKMFDEPPSVPGPGAYHPHEEVEPAKKMVFPKKHYLCISAPAMPLPPPLPFPGPGHYDHKDFQGAEKRFMSSSMFLSTVGRWQGDGREADPPGPPHYHPINQSKKQSFLYNAEGKWV